MRFNIVVKFESNIIYLEMANAKMLEMNITRLNSKTMFFI